MDSEHWENKSMSDAVSSWYEYLMELRFFRDTILNTTFPWEPILLIEIKLHLKETIFNRRKAICCSRLQFTWFLEVIYCLNQMTVKFIAIFLVIHNTATTPYYRHYEGT